MSGTRTHWLILAAACLVLAGAAVGGLLLYGRGPTPVRVSWQVPGATGSTLAYEAMSHSLVTLVMDDSAQPGRASLRPQVSLSCTNPETGETSGMPLSPVAVTDAGGRHLVKVDLSNLWLSLPYPIDPASLESKPAAIIVQKFEQSPYEMSPADLRARFADIAQYMLTTAGHHYSLPLGDGLMRCGFDVSLLETGGSTVVRTDNVPMTISFGRGLPAGTYSRDHGVPTGDSVAWVVPASSVLVGAPASSKADIEELVNLQGKRSPSRATEVRHWDNGSAVGPWIEVLLSQIADEGTNPPRASRALALVSVAMNDAVAAQNAGALGKLQAPCKLDARVRPLDGDCAASFNSTDHAVVAGAASTVLSYLYPKDTARFRALAQQDVEAQLWAGTALRGELEAGLNLGEQVGARVVARGKSDGSDAKWDGRVPRGGQYWVPTPPDFAGPVEPMAGTWKTWNVSSGAQLRPGPPPRPGSSQFETDAREVYEVASHLSIEQQELCSFWEDKRGSYTPPGHWNTIALKLARSTGMSTPAAALMFASMNTAQADAFITAWNTKFTYWSIRPITAVRRELDPDWTPYIYTPPFPSYISGHATTSGAASEVLAHFFPAEAARLQQWAVDAANSRLYGGIHFRADNEVGLKVGQESASAALQKLQRAGLPGAPTARLADR